jgi:hypothetical protein
VKGTFEDLSDEEKTKAFLQLLEYRLKVEKVRNQSTNQPLKMGMHSHCSIYFF